ncbi:MAG: hypothetical protein ACHQ4H_11485 [Ktedonobacterales bacterium]
MRSLPRRGLALTGVLLLLLATLAACSQSPGKRAALSTPTGGAIQITLDRAGYSSAEPLGVSVTNTSKTDFYALDGRSGCTYLQLEFFDTTHSVWAPTLPCTPARQAAPLLLAHGMSEPFTLPPGNASDNGNQWATGTYRIALQYGTQSDASGDMQIAYSAGFQIS